MASGRLHLSFPHGAPPWARWGRRVRIGDRHYRVGRATEADAVLWLEKPPAMGLVQTPDVSDQTK